MEYHLKEDEKAALKIPQGKYQDPEEICITYHQKFIETVKEMTPQVFEDLRPHARSFGILVGNSENYEEIIESLLPKLFECRIILGDYQSPDFDYIWGSLTPLFRFARDNARSQLSSDSDLIIPQKLEGLYQSEVKIIGRNLVNEIIKSNLKRFKNIVEESFKDCASNQNLIFSQFLDLQLNIFKWIKKYNLEKDWLVGGAYHILHQMHKNKNISTKDIPILKKSYSPAVFMYDFHFNPPNGRLHIPAWKLPILLGNYQRKVNKKPKITEGK